MRLDGQLLAGYETTVGAPWTAQSLQFQVGAGSHELRWQGVQIGGDGTSFIDSVTLAAQPVPEPQAVLLMAAGLAALALGRRRARGG